MPGKWSTIDQESVQIFTVAPLYMPGDQWQITWCRADALWQETLSCRASDTGGLVLFDAGKTNNATVQNHQCSIWILKHLINLNVQFHFWFNPTILKNISKTLLPVPKTDHVSEEPALNNYQRKDRLYQDHSNWVRGKRQSPLGL